MLGATTSSTTASGGISAESAPATTGAPSVAVASSKTPDTRVRWTDIRCNPDQRTLVAWYHRNSLVFGMYFFWICGVFFFANMNLYSIWCYLGAIADVNSDPVPAVVHVYVGAMVLYYSYRVVMFPDGQPEWQRLRKHSRRVMAQYPYFPHQACIFEEYEEECLKDPNKPLVKAKDKALFAYHPHGALSVGFGFNGVHSMRFVQSDAKWLVSENLFWFPILSDILRWIGFASVAKPSFTGYMAEDRNLCLIPGGFEEATLYARGKHRVFLKKRAGFIKLALQYGYKVHPVYTFGEEQTYHAMPYFLKQRLWFNSWRIPGILFLGRLVCFFLPLADAPLVTVVGKAIQLPHLPNPTSEDVLKYHEIYIEALVKLFDKHKSKYAIDPSVSLEVY